MSPPPPRRVPVAGPPSAVRTPPPAVRPAPTPPPVRADGPPAAWPSASIRLFPSSNLHSILADVREALRKTDAPKHIIDRATDELLKAPSGTYAALAAEYVTIDTGPPQLTRRGTAAAAARAERTDP